MRRIVSVRLAAAGLAGAILVGALGACASPLLGPPPATATEGPRQATLAGLENVVEMRPNVVADFAPAAEAQVLPEGGQVRTGPGARVRVELGHDARIQIGPASLLTLERFNLPGESPRTRLRFAFGKLWLTLGADRVEAVTPIGPVRAQGALAEFHYSVGSDPDSTTDDVLLIRCLEGSCAYNNVVNLRSLEQLVVTGGGLAISGPDPLPVTAIDDFLANSPTSLAMAITLTAIGPTATPTHTPTGTPTPTDAPTPTATAARATATPTGTPTSTRPPPPATSTAVLVQPTETTAPLPADTQPPPPPPAPTNTQAPPPPPTNTLAPAPTQPLPTSTLTPPPTSEPPTAAPATLAPEPTSPRQNPPTKTPEP